MHSPLRVFSVVSAARTSGGATFVRQVVAVMTGVATLPQDSPTRELDVLMPWNRREA